MKPFPVAFRRRLSRKWLVRIGIILVIYTLVGFLLLPAIVKWQMRKQLPGLTKRVVEVQQVRMNPYALSLTIRGFSLKEPNGDVFCSFDELYVNFGLVSSLFKWAAAFQEISLKNPFGNVIYQKDGTFNFSNLASETPAAPEPKASSQALPRLVIDQLKIENGLVIFADLTRKEPFQDRFGPINIHLTRFSTLPRRDSPYSIVATTDAGESFSWSGDVSINPVRSSGRFKLEGLTIKKYSPYLADYARFEVVDGRINVQADYRYDATGGAVALDVTKAGLDLLDLKLKSPDTGETVVSIPSLFVKDADASLTAQTAHVGLIVSGAGSILCRLNKDGSINLLSLIRPPPSAESHGPSEPAKTTVAGAAKGPAWKFKLDEFRLEDYGIRAEDLTQATPARLNLSQINLAVKGVSLDPNAPVLASLSLRCNEAGTVALDGTLWPFKPSAEMQVSVTNLDLRMVQPYLDGKLRLAITGGALGTKGRVWYAVAGTNAPLLRFTGDLSLSRFAAVDTMSFQNCVAWNALTVRGIDLGLQPNRLQMDEVRFDGLKTSVIILSNRMANLSVVLQPSAAPANQAAASSPPSPGGPVQPTSPAALFPVQLGALAFENSSFGFADQSVEPNVATAIQEFGGTIQGLSSTENKTATVNLAAKVDGRSPFTVSGRINPFGKDLFVDLAIALKNDELMVASPYAAKYAGYPLDKGKLSFDLRYNVEQRHLKAENKVNVDRLKLGAKTDSPDAVKLPVKLAIALLQDRNGLIALDVPVTGNLDDPKFRLGPIIFQVFMNMITKAVTSPFKLLGSLVGGGDELSFVEFQPGRAEFAEGEAKKLDALARALYERPGLELEIAGAVDPVADRDAIAHIKLEQQMKVRRIRELTAAGKPAAPVESMTLDPKDYERLITLAYGELTGTLVPVVSASRTALIPVSKAQATLEETSTKQNAMIAILKPVEKTKRVQKKSGPQPSAAEKPPGELTLADMESKLIERIAITEDDFRALMQERAGRVQKVLLDSGKVASDRLFLIAPKPVGSSAQGQSRVNLALD